MVANRQIVLAIGTSSEKMEEVECYDSSGSKQAVTGLTNKLNFIFVNPGLTSQETRCAFFNTATSCWEALTTTDFSSP